MVIYGVIELYETAVEVHCFRFVCGVCERSTRAGLSSGFGRLECQYCAPDGADSSPGTREAAEDGRDEPSRHLSSRVVCDVPAGAHSELWICGTHLAAQWNRPAEEVRGAAQERSADRDLSRMLPLGSLPEHRTRLQAAARS